MTSSSAAISIVTHDPELDDVRMLLREYNSYLATTIDPHLLLHRETELAALPGVFVPPAGALFLATHDGLPLACAGLRPAPLAADATLDATRTAEFCRLWVTPSARGQHLGARILDSTIELARAFGYTTLVLNSAPATMQTAQRLYHRAGLRPIPPYKLVSIPGIAFFALDLTAA